MENNTSVAVATLPATSAPIRSRKGRQTGTKYFVGEQTASQLKETGKALGMKGSALKVWVNEALSDTAAARAAGTAAALAALTAAGFAGDTVIVRKGTASINLVKVEAAPAPVQSLAAQLVAKGKFATIEEAEAFLA